MFTKLLLPIFTCLIVFGFKTNVAGQDTIPPKITIDEAQISANFPLGDPGLDWRYKTLKKDTIAIELSCLYSFPDEYYFKMENVIIKDDSGILKDTIVVDDIIFDEKGYGKLIQTIIAEDNSGNISKLVFISEFSGSEYLFDVLGIKVGEIEVLNNDFPFTLDKTNFDLCDAKNVDVKLLYSKNGCTGGTRIDWYINNERVKINSDNISIDISNEPDGIELAAEGKYSNTNFQDRVKINIQKISNQNIIEKYDPSCLNSADGIINIDPGASNVKWKHNNSNASFLNALKAGSYYVSYTYNGCEFNDTITLDPKNILDFSVSDTIVDLNQNRKITIKNNSKKVDEFLWQIGDSTFINNEKEFDYTFKSPGKYVVKLTDKSGFCNETIVKNIVVEGTTSVLDNPVSSIRIGPNPFTDFLNIDLEKSADYEITIFGVDGRIYLKNQIYDKGNVKLNLGFLVPGIYILSINSTKNSEPVKDFKIVKLIGN